MFKNYLKIALRNIAKSKIYSLINISGLTIGMAGVLLIAVFIQSELSYDEFHDNADRIYRLTKSYNSPSADWVGTPPPLAPALEEQFPEIENFVRIDPLSFMEKSLFTFGEKSFYEKDFVLADKSLFEVFNFNLVNGDSKSALNSPSSIVISKSVAYKYFGDEEAMNKILRFDNRQDFVVSGIMEDVPENSHLKFDMVASYEFMNEIYESDKDRLKSWGQNNYYTYLLLKQDTNAAEFEKKSSLFINELFEDNLYSLFIQPITDIHLNSNAVRDPVHQGSLTSLYLYSVIAIVILLIACINFMNLYTANSELRSREVGMRKVLGAQKIQLVLQFLGEALILSIIALPLAVLLVEFLLPGFNQLTGKLLTINYTQNFSMIWGLAALTIIVGLVSGSYPAFFISSFQPIKMLRGKLNAGSRGNKFRNILVVFQFMISITFISGSLLINSQMDFIMNKDLGYDRENVLNIPIYSQSSKDNYEIFKKEIIVNSNILDASASSFNPSVERWREGSYFEGREDSDELMFFRMSCDYDFLDMLGIEVVAGRSFDKSYPTDRGYAHIINESAVREIGWTNEEAIGKVFNTEEGRVIGVVKDFNFRSLRNETEAMAISILPRFMNYAVVKIGPENISNTIEFLKDKWNGINPGIPFEYNFYDDEFDKLYKADLKLKTIFEYFSFLAILIACMGLFGLALFITQQRTKEVGIRKVLGANFRQITALLTKDFVKLIIISFVIAVPVTYYFITQWLEEFKYKIELDVFTFLLAGVIALLIALATVSYQVIKIYFTNPAEVLKNE